MLDAKSLIGTHDVIMLTFDTLRFDVAQKAFRDGRTPNLCDWMSGERWERRHSPGNFTYAAHHAFFAGFLPTPAQPGPHARLFASEFLGSETTTERTFVFPEPTLPEGLAARGYYSICIGGVGFFNLQTQLGSVFARMFHESHWDASLGVTCRESTENQVNVALDRIDRLNYDQRVFLFINISAIHQPNCIYLDGCDADSPATQAAALGYVDACLEKLITTLRRRAPLMCIFTSDHGTAYGEDGYTGHRLSHQVVWDVPYAEFVLQQQSPEPVGMPDV